MAAGDIEALAKSVAAERALNAKVQALLIGLAEQMKATSNDQNVQAFARELRGATPQLVEAILGVDA